LLLWWTNNPKAPFYYYCLLLKYPTIISLKLFSNHCWRLIKFLTPCRNDIFYYYIGRTVHLRFCSSVWWYLCTWWIIVIDELHTHWNCWWYLVNIMIMWFGDCCNYCFHILGELYTRYKCRWSCELCDIMMINVTPSFPNM